MGRRWGVLIWLMIFTTRSMIDAVSALIGHMNGNVEIRTLIQNDWRQTLSWSFDGATKDRDLAAILPLNAEEWLLIGVSVQGNYTNFVIYNFQDRSVRPHPQFIVYGRVAAAVQYDEDTIFVVGLLQGTGDEPNSGGVVMCQREIGCIPQQYSNAMDPPQLFASDTTYHLFQIEPTNQLILFSDVALWTFDVISAWTRVESIQHFDWTLAIASDHVYVAGRQTDIYETFPICASQPKIGSYVIAQMPLNFTTYGATDCEIVVFSNNSLEVKSGESSFVWSEHFFPSYVFHVWPGGNRSEEWSVDSPRDGYEDIWIYEGILFCKTSNQLFWTFKLNSTWKSYNASLTPFLIQDQLWVFPVGETTIIGGKFDENSTETPNSIHLDVVGPTLEPYKGCVSSSANGTAWILLTIYSEFAHEKLILYYYDGVNVTDVTPNFGSDYYYCSTNYFFVYDSSLKNITYYGNGEMQTVPPFDRKFDITVPNYFFMSVTEAGAWTLAWANQKNATLCAFEENSWKCMIILEYFNNLFLLEDVVYGSQNNNNGLYLREVSFQNNATIQMATNGVLRSAVNGPNGTLIFAGSMCNQLPFYQCDRVMILSPNFTRNFYLRSPALNLDGIRQISYFPDENIVYLLTDSKAYSFLPFFPPKEIPSFSDGSILQFCEIVLPSLDLKTPSDSFSFWAKIVCLVVAAILVSIVVSYSYCFNLKKEYIVLKPQLETKFTEDEENLGKFLARGAFGSVAMVRHPNGGVYAAKYINLQNDSQLEDLALQEIEILKKLQHRNTISLRDFTKTEDRIIIYTDLFDAAISDLYLKRTFNLKELSIIGRGMILGIEYIHSLNIAHRDIKPSNVLVSITGHDRIERVVLADFGVAVQVEGKQIPAALVGSNPYIAPELTEITNSKYDPFKADVYSYGLSIWEICRQRKLSLAEINSPILLNDELKSWKRIIKRCLKRAPTERIAVPEIIGEISEVLE